MRTAARQDGSVLPIALIILVAMTLIGLALFRSVDTGTQVANNLSFRQSALSSADGGTEAAVAWLINNKALLGADQMGSGYYANEQLPIDYTGKTTTLATDDVLWDGTANAQCGAAPSNPRCAYPVPGTDAAGNRNAYIIHRMCDAATGTCATATAAASTGGTKGAVSYGQYAIAAKSKTFYRITTRTIGARNTVSYVQSMVVVED